jgi:hypothetical protein
MCIFLFHHHAIRSQSKDKVDYCVWYHVLFQESYLGISGYACKPTSSSEDLRINFNL